MKLPFALALAFTFFCACAAKAQIAIGTMSPSTSAILDLTSTTQGLLPPRMNTAQMNAVSSPAIGLMVYNTDSHAYFHYIGSAWYKNLTNADRYWAANGLNIYRTNGVNVGIGTNTPSGLLHVANGAFLNSGLFGVSPPVSSSGSGTRMYFNPADGSFRAGATSGNQWDGFNRGPYSAAIGQDNSVSGGYAFAGGQSNQVTGLGSFAYGSKDTVVAPYSIAFGQNNYLGGNNSFAAGNGNSVFDKVSYAIGDSNWVQGDHNFIAGSYNAISSGQYNMVFGNYNDIEADNYNTLFGSSNFVFSGDHNAAFGDHNKVSGNNSLISGYNNTDSAGYVVVGGYNHVISPAGAFSAVFGNTNTLSGASSIVGGYNNKSFNAYNIVAGSGNYVFAQSAIASGSNNRDSADNSLVLGANNILRSGYSRGMAIGMNNLVMADDAFACGKGDTASGGNTIALGIGNRAASYGETVLGVYATNYAAGNTTAINGSDRLFNIGNGGGAFARSDAFTVLKNGRIGIGTSSPSKAKLQVEGNATAALSFAYFNGNNQTGTGSGTFQFSIYASDRIAGLEFNAFSDARIKHIIARSNSATDLATLMKLRITDYRHIDTVEHGSGISKKVIAQEVEAVYPYAVKQTVNEIPDIYKLATINNGIVRVANTLKKGEKVKLIFSGRTELAEVLEADATSFKVALNDEGQVFVYGRQVNDFRTVDYEALTTLNISATQELVRKIEALEKSSASVLQKLEALSAEVERLKTAGVSTVTSR